MAKETENLPVLFEHGGAAAPVSPAYFGAEEESAMPVSHYLWAIRRQVWKILVFVATCVIGTFVFSSRLQPIYESTATISIDRNAPDALVGQDSQKSPAPQDADQYIVTQVDMIQSDAVLRPVAQKFDLLQREGKLKGLSPDRIEALRNGPTKLARLRVSRPPGTYLVEISYRSPIPSLPPMLPMRSRNRTSSTSTGCKSIPPSAPPALWSVNSTGSRREWSAPVRLSPSLKRS